MDIQEMIQLYQRGWTSTQLAQRYGKTPPTIRCHLRKHGARVRSRGEAQRLQSERDRRRVQIDVDRIRRLTEEGLTTAEIGEHLGVCAETVRRRMKQHEIPRLPAKSRPEKNHFWNGGRIVDKSGYVLVKTPKHPHATKAGYVREHRLVLEKVLGRYLGPKEVVHHKNGNRSDNHPGNLQLYESNGAHLREEMPGKKLNLTPEGRRKLRENGRRLVRWNATHRWSETGGQK